MHCGIVFVISSLLLATAYKSSSAPAPTHRLSSKALDGRVAAGGIVSLRNNLCGESLVQPPPSQDAFAVLQRVGSPDLLLGAARIDANTISRAKHTFRTEWHDTNDVAIGGMEALYDVDEGSGDIVVTQNGEAPEGSLYGCVWTLADVPDSFEVLVPGASGQRFSREAPPGRRTFDYPMLWEASFALVQGRRGGFLIWADDDQPRFKTLVVERRRQSFQLRFESRNVAPFEACKRIQSSRWRIRAYKGDWLVGAAIYRDWSERRGLLAPIASKGPSWARDIRFVAILAADSKMLAPLSKRVYPQRTLLYVADWRRDGYDRNYPDYTPRPEFAAFISEAHRLGFRVMAHVNYFGCDPKNPLYEKLKNYQIKDPLTGQLQWWEWPANPPIKFGYINPASKGWRECLVERMVELCRALPIDALHLDQTLCIYNDGNGLINGLDMIQGSLALHRELREALPDVALSGEGLNEITSRYEHFAQRHIWGFDHTKDHWVDRWIAMSHPVSSSVLTPATQIYGYLGFANPRNLRALHAWQRAYEHFGVIPTYAWPDQEQLANPPPAAREILEVARFFQEEQLVPDYSPGWAEDELFVWRTKDGRRAAIRSGGGSSFGFENASGKWHVLQRRIEGVNILETEGSIPGWLAYSANKVLALDPRHAYVWTPAPPDRDELHLSAVPAGLALTHAKVGEKSAEFRLEAVGSLQEINIWDFGGTTRCGVTLRDGTVRAVDGIEILEDPTGGVVHTDGDGIFMHPPWKPGVPGTGPEFTWIDMEVPLPETDHVVFTSRLEIKPSSLGKSDGVRFYADATSGSEKRKASVHFREGETNSLWLNLQGWGGRKVSLKLSTDVGPGGRADFDWARWVQPRISGEDSKKTKMVNLQFSGGKQKVANVSTPAGEVQWNSTAGGLRVRAPMPGTIVLQFAEHATKSRD